MNATDITPEQQTYVDGIEKMFTDGAAPEATSEPVASEHSDMKEPAMEGDEVFENKEEKQWFEGKRAMIIARENSALADQDQQDGHIEEHSVAPIVIPNKGGARSIDLTYPPTVDGKRLTKIRMRMPLQEDLDAWSFGEIRTIREFISRLTGIHTEVLAKLSWPDSDALHSIFEGITPEYLLKARED